MNIKIKGIEIVFANSFPLSKMLFAWFDMNSIRSHIIILRFEICHIRLHLTTAFVIPTNIVRIML